MRVMCEVQLKDRKRYTDLMLILGLSETYDQLATQTLFVGKGMVMS